MSKLSETYNILSPNKKLSQLIAQSWLDGERLDINKKFLIKNDILSKEEAEYYEVVVRENPPGPPYRGVIDAVEGRIVIPYPDRPAEVTDEDLEQWVNSDTNSPPWIPPENLQILLPVLDTIIGR